LNTFLYSFYQYRFGSVFKLAFFLFLVLVHPWRFCLLFVLLYRVGMRCTFIHNKLREHFLLSSWILLRVRRRGRRRIWPWGDRHSRPGLPQRGAHLLYRSPQGTYLFAYLLYWPHSRYLFTSCTDPLKVRILISCKDPPQGSCTTPVQSSSRYLLTSCTGPLEVTCSHPVQTPSRYLLTSFTYVLAHLLYWRPQGSCSPPIQTSARFRLTFPVQTPFKALAHLFYRPPLKVLAHLQHPPQLSWSTPVQRTP
jgi:hypothetical protein